MLTVLLVSVFVLAYVVAGYPLLLRLLVAVRGPRHVRQADITPTLSFVISAYNEAGVIRGKLQNALALDYPADCREIIVISDCSDDDTDDIVREFAGQGVRLVRQDERRGKTAGLNRALPLLVSEIVVFSDANAIYNPDALRKLVRNFADDKVGYVTGEARYLLGGRAAADAGERAYWGYEMELKRLETQIGSMVGGDGAIYAIRRPLWRTLPEDAINDFLNPLQIVEAGWRGIYEPEAICYEETSGRFKSEYKRRVRIVSRSWRAVFQAGGVLNPFRVGLFSWCLISHKVLRWNAGAFATIGALAALVLIVEAVGRWPVPSLAALAAGTVAALTPLGRRIVSMAAYFWVINAASFVGVAKGTFGRVSGVWSTPREHAAQPVGTLVPVGPIFFVGGTLLAAVLMIVGEVLGITAARVAFWSSLAAIVYVYALYPLILSLLRIMARRPIKVEPIEPTVCLFIAANDEAAVIEAKLRNALSLDYPAERLEIVVASDGSVDGTDEIVKRFAPRVRLIAHSPRRGKIAAINHGLESVACDVVVFSDANTFLAPDAIRALVRNFASPDVGCVSGDVVLVGDRALLGKSEDLYYRYERWIQHAESDIGSMIGADGALYAIRRRLFVPRAEDTILDDMAIPMSIVRAGGRVVFEPAARAHEPGVESASEEFSRKTRVVAGAMQFLARSDSEVPISAPQVILSLVSHKALRWFSPAFALVLFVTSLMLTGTGTYHEYRAVWVTSSAIMALGALGMIPRLRRIPLVGLSHYLCLVQAAAAAGFLKGLSGRQSVLWRRFMRPAGPEPGQQPGTDRGAEFLKTSGRSRQA
jgi:cellulose synthase/poly-beta-1,6-N-acetylglucosamine synthase-like glycosyltransferase